jgi:hypothetical protein
MRAHTAVVRSLRLGGLLAIGALLLACLAPGTHAATNAATRPARSTSPPLRIRPLAAVDGGLLYLADHSTHRVGVHVHSADATLHVLMKSGAHRRLGTLGKNAGVVVAGSMVGVVSDGNDPNDSCLELGRWWDLATGRHGTAKFTCGQAPLGVSPDGWLYVLREGDKQHVWLLSLKGNRTDLGDPLPDTEFYDLLTGAHGVVAFSDTDDDDSTEAAGFAYMPWTHPGTWRALHNPRDPDDRCSGLSTHYLACDQGGTIVVFPLSGQKPTMSGQCAAQWPVVYQGRGLWVGGEGGPCATGHLAELSPTGKITVSTRRYKLPGSPVPALGRIMITNPSQSEILALSGIDAKPHVVLSTS